MPAPTTRSTAPVRTAAPAQGTAQTNARATVPAIPFTRAARVRSALFGFPTATLSAQTTVLQPVQLPPGGYMKWIELNVVATATGNSATVAFQPDAPASIIQQLSLTAANGDPIITPIDGVTLYALNKYLGSAFGLWQMQMDPGFSAVAGAGATGGSFSFTLYVPVEIDSRDALGALENMAANQAYALTVFLNPLASIYSTTPTAAPVITVTATYHYWTAPDASSPSTGALQQSAPNGVGTVGLIQQQTPPITPNSVQNTQVTLVGNTLRFLMFCLRNSSGARDSSQWPAEFDVYVNTDKWYAKTKASWLAQIQNAYDFTNPPAATIIGAANAADAGIFPFIDFINSGEVGANRVDASQNRNLWLVTGSGTGVNIEAHQWGPTAAQLQITAHAIRPSSPEALYAPQYV